MLAIPCNGQILPNIALHPRGRQLKKLGGWHSDCTNNFHYPGRYRYKGRLWIRRATRGPAPVDEYKFVGAGKLQRGNDMVARCAAVGFVIQIDLPLCEPFTACERTTIAKRIGILCTCTQGCRRRGDAMFEFGLQPALFCSPLTLPIREMQGEPNHYRGGQRWPYARLEAYLTIRNTHGLTGISAPAGHYNEWRMTNCGAIDSRFRNEAQ